MRTSGLWLLRGLAIAMLGLGMYGWGGLSPRVLIQFDRTSLADSVNPSAEQVALPVDHHQTRLRCLGPVGLIVGLGVLGLALGMSLLMGSFPWPLRVLVSASPLVLIMLLASTTWDLHPWIRPVVRQIAGAQLALAIVGALLSQPIVQRLRAGRERAAVTDAQPAK